jgi:hypothetical protein
MRKLTREECEFAMKNGEFPKDITASAPAVAIVLTQSWCPQWAAMKAYLPKIESEVGPGLSLFTLEYDLEPFFEEFMAFKEDRFGNRSVPYVRYYRNGELAAESNFVMKDMFLAKLPK